MRDALSRRAFLREAAAGSALALAASSARAAAPTGGRRPNIVFLFSDDQRADAMGCAGNPVIQTPEHDRLAREGVLFENAFVTTAICCVSRASALTGQYARRHGIDDFFKVFSDAQRERLYPTILRDHGYWTGFIGKWGIGANDLANVARASDLFDFWAGGSHQTNFWHERDCPFVTADPVDAKTANVCTCPPDARGVAGYNIRIGKEGIEDPVHQTTEIVPMRVRQFLERRDTDKPFCLSVSFKTPHGPWQDYPERFAALYADDEMPLAPTVSEAEANRQPAFLQASLANSRVVNRDAKAAQMRQYYRAIATQDYAMGGIRRALAEAGVADNTVILFMSDNGHFLGEHGFGGKWLMYEESIRVPCIIHDPRLPDRHRGARRGQMVLNIDLAPTMLALAGVPVPAGMQGRSLLPLMTNGDAPWRGSWFYEHTYAHNGAIEPSEGVRTTEWKYIRYHAQDPVVEQLFNLQADPLETENLANDPAHSEVLGRLRAAWRAYRERLR